MSKPLVSVLIPCYNVENYVIESVTSILDQTYTNLEVIIINDCSTDSTKEKLELLAKKDTRIKIYNNDVNLRLIKTLNKGIELCSGKYIARMDADDISLPTRIEKQVSFFDSHPDYDIVSTMFYTFRSGTEKRNLYRNPTLFEDLQAYLLFKNGICHPAAMIRKTLFTEKNLKFETDYLHVEDYALWSKALYCSKLANLDEALLNYRVHEQQVSTLNNDSQTENKKEVFKIHCEKLNLPTTSEFLDIYASVAECVPKYSTIDFIKSCEEFMLLLIDKNDKELFCSQRYLKAMLALHWLRLCANSKIGFKIFDICRKSLLYDGSKYRYTDNMIFFTKCLFKMEYKKSFLYKIVFR